jgi:hypothetical protein
MQIGELDLDMALDNLEPLHVEGLAFCRKVGASLHMVFYTMQPRWQGGEMVMQKRPTSYLVLPVASLDEAIAIAKDAKTAPPDMGVQQLRVMQ